MKHSYYLQKLEISKILDELTQNSNSKLNTSFFQGEKVLWSNCKPNAIWKVQLSDNRSVLMRHPVGEKGSDYYIVHVDAKRFYKEWLKSNLVLNKFDKTNHASLLKDMDKDYKYQHAVNGFKDNESSPVPLPLISFEYWYQDQVLDFTDGITRTKWLLFNGAKTFPVSVRGEETAKLVAEVMGLNEFFHHISSMC